MNLGIFAGGIADGYSKGLNDQRKQQEIKLRQDEVDRQNADRKLDEEVNKDTAEYMKKRLGAIQSPSSQEKPTAPATVVENPAARGITGESAQVERPSSPIAGGIQAPAQNATASVEDLKLKVRQPDINDMVDVAQHRASLYLQKGNYTKAIDAHKDYMAFAAEKLKSEEVQRAHLAKGAVTGIMVGDYSGLGALYDTLPDGNKLQSVTPNKDGTITIAVVAKDGKEKPPVTFKNGEHLANAVVSLVDTNTALQYMDRNGKAEIEAAKTKFDQENKTDTLAETKRNHIATEGIARTKAAEGSEATTAEIKNARVFFPELYAKKPADALSAFKDLTNGEKDASAVRMKLNAIYSDSMKGGWPKEAGKSQQERDAFLEKRVNYFTGKAPDAAPPPEKREIGKAYPTPRGMMIWRGNGWSAN